MNPRDKKTTDWRHNDRAGRPRAARWVDVTGPMYLRKMDAELRASELGRQFPGVGFRAMGGARDGFRVERREA